MPCSSQIRFPQDSDLRHKDGLVALKGRHLWNEKFTAVTILHPRMRNLMRGPPTRVHRRSGCRALVFWSRSGSCCHTVCHPDTGVTNSVAMSARFVIQESNKSCSHGIYFLELEYQSMYCVCILTAPPCVLRTEKFGSFLLKTRVVKGGSPF